MDTIMLKMKYAIPLSHGLTPSRLLMLISFEVTKMMSIAKKIKQLRMERVDRTAMRRFRIFVTTSYWLSATCAMDARLFLEFSWQATVIKSRAVPSYIKKKI